MIKKIIPLFLSFVLFVCCIFPVFRFGDKGAFYSIDPDVVYVANAMSYIKNGVIGYYDHPGTVSINLISKYYFPLRLISKFFLHHSFIDWAYSNISFLFFYTRLIQSLIFFSGIVVFFKSILKITRSTLSAFISLLLLMSYGPFYFTATAISAETLTVFLVCVWILMFVNYLSAKAKRQHPYILTMLLLSGLLFANRATAFAYLPISLYLFLFTEKYKNREFIGRFIFGVFAEAAGFTFGIYPLGSRAVGAVSRVLFFANSTGIHGDKAGTFFNLSAYLASLKVYISGEPVAVILFILVVVLSLYSFMYKKDRRVGATGVILGLVILVFAKFPLTHYQVPNVLMLILLTVYYLRDIKTSIKLISIALLLILVIPIAGQYQRGINDLVKNEVALEDFASGHNSNKSNVWQWARSKQFSLLWIRDWGNLFEEKLEESRVYEISGNLDNINITGDTLRKIDNSCDFQYFIQNSSVPKFIEVNNTQKFIIENIPGNRILSYITASGCN